MQHREQFYDTFVDPGQNEDTHYSVGSDGVKYEVQREQRLTSDQPRVWHGSIGSGEELVKDARILHALRDNHDLVGLEMEVAGIMNFIPVGVIRGVGNYRDEDKTEE